jgi:hypothetical protein
MSSGHVAKYKNSLPNIKVMPLDFRSLSWKSDAILNLTQTFSSMKYARWKYKPKKTERAKQFKFVVFINCIFCQFFTCHIWNMRKVLAKRREKWKKKNRWFSFFRTFYGKITCFERLNNFRLSCTVVEICLDISSSPYESYSAEISAPVVFWVNLMYLILRILIFGIL